MRLRAVLLALAVASLAAPASADSTVYISGRVVDGSGRPVAGARVSWELRPNRAVYNQHDCPVRPWEIQCRVHKVAGTTSSAGRYRLPVRLSSYLASPVEHDLFVTDRALPGTVAPARTYVRFYFNRKSMDVVDLPVWRGRPALDPAGPAHRTLSLDPLSAPYGTPYPGGPSVELLQGSAVVWRFAEVAEERLVDARTVEQGTNAVRATARAIVRRLPATYWSTAYPLTGGVRPVSRGRACATYGRSDTVVALPRCAFTDGRLATPVSATYQRAGGKACEVASECAHPRWLRVDLGSVTPVGAVALRGCALGAVEVSAEGTTFVPYPTHDLGDGVHAGPPLPARYVRADLAECYYGATELSVFAPLAG